MRALATRDIFIFADFRLDCRRGGLFRRGEDGADILVALGSRALDILALLIDRHGDLVTKDEITAAVWRGAVVEDSNLTVHIAALRRVLDEGRAQGSCIQTIVGARLPLRRGGGAARCRRGCGRSGYRWHHPASDRRRPTPGADRFWAVSEPRSSGPCDHQAVDGVDPGSGLARHDRRAALVDRRVAVCRFQRRPQSATFRRPDH